VVLQQPALGEAGDGLADDQVVEHAHVDQRQRLGEAAGDGLVGAGGLGRTAGVVVRQDDCRCLTSIILAGRRQLLWPVGEG
jgi:hypothetical protein